MCSFGIEKENVDSSIWKEPKCKMDPVWRFKHTAVCYCDFHKKEIIKCGSIEKDWEKNDKLEL